MKRIQLFVFLILALLTLVPVASGQDDAQPITAEDPEMANPAAHISFPPPVYVVRDRVDIRGTVNWDIMRNFFIEFRRLILDMTMDEAEDHQWFPGTLPRIEAVEDDVLGTWDTVTLPDGLYELRLTINIGGSVPEYVRVSPIRVENSLPSFATEEQAMMAAEPMLWQPEPEAEPDPSPDPSPRVVVNVIVANVRSGDSTSYPRIGQMLEGQSASVKGVSSSGSGWYYIELANGRRGFIFPGIVDTEGDFSNLPQISPPLLPPTPVPIPIAVPQPQPQQQQPTTGPDLYIENAVIHPHPVTCGQTYRIDVTVRNGGLGAATSGGLIEVRDSGLAGSAAPQTTRIAFGALAPGHITKVFGHLTPTVHVETLHHINMYLDVNNQVAETNENNNLRAEKPYMLTGRC